MSLITEITKTAARHGAQKHTAGRGIMGAVLGIVATRIATRSVPGAILVGGAALGKYLWDKKKEREASTVETVETVSPKP